MTRTKHIAILGMLTALYVVLSAFLKFTLVSNIMMDLGYIVFAIALCMYGSVGTVVGVIGCALESILFSAYGFSVSWVAANLCIGLICGPVFARMKHTIMRVIVTVFAVAIGMIAVKTIIECNMYSIPYYVKIPKNLVAFGADAVTMIAGIFFWQILKGRTRLTEFIDK